MNDKRFDIMLDYGGDIVVSETGDIAPTDSIRQAVIIRLRWFLDEWRFAPTFGMPYFEEILVKNPDLERIKVIIRDECLTVDGVKDITNIAVEYSPHARAAVFRLNIVTGEDIYREEVRISV
ncbi:hypothetical protein FACS1894208_07240 [Clostridia bacterium]|nr:hypothetical protein FACS1894208_07240 [Clostridia bacterium]